MAVPEKKDKNDKAKISQQLLAGLAMASQVAMRNPLPGSKAVASPNQVLDEKSAKLALDISQEEQQEVLNKLVSYVNSPAGYLEGDSALYLEEQLSELLGFPVRQRLEGQQLNHSIGIMGAEQHLPRFPGDTLAQHDAYQEAGITSTRGAFAWFTDNGQLSEQAILNEKYYFAVQLMYLSNWSEQSAQLKPWYKYRKMVVINPAEQLAVVGVVADAGPAQWVQKQFGGSPEVIQEGKIWSQKSRGKVILLFVDDPENIVPLGPIQLDHLSVLARKKSGQPNPLDLLKQVS